MIRIKPRWIWSWVLVTFFGIIYFTGQLYGEDKSRFQPGPVSAGHHQIKNDCAACHGFSFGGKAAIQDRCLKCHGEELAESADSHSRKKFLDPRHFDRLEKLDATQCVTCHTEHRPEITTKNGLTAPQDFCLFCHAEIAKDRPSHKDLSFNSCNDAGCHNYHDNRNLYEDFLSKQITQEDVSNPAQIAARNYVEMRRYFTAIEPQSLTIAEQNAPPHLNDPKILQDWSSTLHATMGVNCSHCHLSTLAKNDWVLKPTSEICGQCHEEEFAGFSAGKHGMRFPQQLNVMTPAQALQPMKKQNANKPVNCIACHASHRFDTRVAAVESCLGCHADRHSQAYQKSPHYDLWRAELTDPAKKGQGVSCATCHLPRQLHRYRGQNVIRVQHNQNYNLRPNEKMLREVCMPCHSAGFSLDALADQNLILNNFKGRPAKHIQSIDMAIRRAQKTSLKSD